MVTRKHFKEIAKILGTSNSVVEIVRRITDFLETTYDKFDRERFNEAVRKHYVGGNKAEN